MPEKPGDTEGRLAPCPHAPHCVSSEARDAAHHVAPLRLKGPPGEAWHAVVELVAALPRTRVVTRTDDYLHVACRSAAFRFVDDLELLLRRGRHEISIRSASRMGYYDFGVNRRRVEGIRERLQKHGVVE